ncbi:MULTISPECIES: acyl-CoA dehydrogenase family protein [Caballeronia]|uniref:Acyl-CoA dehydrogenase n=1 Tax=Caballeronia zhejiangensis TaxID=871203 RepID=A0A656QE42_9BURK|nr:MULTISPECIES: acyl-CoA dehydrogenase family protein [Caballeronia]EKS71827.1 acyl-CoA dehydrogenase domain-containing protein [Burkholderia sp. SJ98]KDR25335.1 acyl-CoA dehydrogenase [Caballeronia zhejiangensis]
MISFELSEDQTIAQSALREFAAEVLAPNARGVDDEAKLSASTLDLLWSLGVAQSRLDTDEAGGALMSALLLEELARGDASAAVAVASSLGFAAAIRDFGSPEQVERFRSVFAEERFHAAGVLLVEPTPAFDRTNLRTTARVATGGYLLSGVKSFVPLVDDCQHFLVVAKLNDEQVAFIVDAGCTGLTISNRHATLGLRGLGAGEIAFDNVFVPEQNRLGGHGSSVVDRLLDASRASLSAILTGVSASVMDYVIPYTKERVAHGSELAKKQVIAFRIADMHMKIEGMRWMYWRAASTIDQQRPSSRFSRLSQIYASRNAMWIADEGLQMLGGHGYTRDFPLEMWYRDVRTLSVLDGIVGI